MSKKDISMESYQWGHFAAIIVDAIIFSVIAYLAWSVKGMIKREEKNFLDKGIAITRLKIIFWLGVFFAFITLLGLIPVFKDYDEIVIN